MSKNTVLKSSQTVIWIQPGGPGYECFPLCARDVGDLEEKTGDVEPIQLFSATGNGWDDVGSKSTPPEAIGVDMDGLIFEDRDWLEKVKCEFDLYFLSTDCGKANIISNYVRGQGLTGAKRVGRKYASIAKLNEDVEQMFTASIKASPFLLDIDALRVDRMTTAETQIINDISANTTEQCAGDCGDEITLGEQLIFAADSAVGPATANIGLSTDEGVTWASAAVDPFGAGLDAKSAIRFLVGRSTTRLLAGREGTGGAVQGGTAYSDDAGATWTQTNVGGAAAGHGVTGAKGLFSLSERFIFLAGAAGYIYRSTTGGTAWTAVESAVITAGAYRQVHFANELYGIACAAADIIALTDDGGDTWYAATATGGGAAINTCVRFDKSRMLVGDAGGRLYQSFNGGVTWTQITGWSGAGAGAVRDLHFLNDNQGLMVADTAAPVGWVFSTFNGGRDWVRLTTPTNIGLNAVWYADKRLGFAAGNVQAGTAVILKIQAA